MPSTHRGRGDVRPDAIVLSPPVSSRPQSLFLPSFRNRQDQDENVARALVGSDASHEFRLRHPRQVGSEKDQLRPHLLAPGITSGAEQEIQRSLTVADDLDWVRKPRPLECARCLGRRPRVVFHQQDISHLVRHQSRVSARCGCRRFGGVREKMPNGDLERPRQIRGSPKRHVALTPLYVGKVGAVDAGPPCQFLLRNSKSVPASPNYRPKPGLQVGVGSQDVVSRYQIVRVVHRPSR